MIRWEHYHLLFYKQNLFLTNNILARINETLTVTMILKCNGMNELLLLLLLLLLYQYISAKPVRIKKHQLHYTQ